MDVFFLTALILIYISPAVFSSEIITSNGRDVVEEVQVKFSIKLYGNAFSTLFVSIYVIGSCQNDRI